MTTSFAFDRDMTQNYIEALTGDKLTAVTWQYFHHSLKHSPDKRNKQAGHPHGDYQTNYRTLEKKQAEGCGIFVMVNAGDAKGRKAENVTEVRALFVDLDGSPKEPVISLLTPHIIVESSPGRYHLYWKVADCPLEQFTILQRTIALKFGGDTSCVDLCRVLRVPGFWHLKGDPVMTRLLGVNKHSAYTVEEVIAGLGLEVGTATPVQQNSSTPLTELQQTSTIAGADSQQSSCIEIVIPETGEVVNLGKWAALNPEFDLVTALKQKAPLRGVLRDGKQHIQCPFESEHTDQVADCATFVANKGNGFTSWDIHCRHSHCADRDRLHFLKAMLEKGWLSLELLTGSREPVERKRPPKIYMPHIDMATDIAWTSLNHDELRVALHLFYLSSREVSGTLPDNNWMMARNLGLDQDTWLSYRETLERVGWLMGDGVRLWNNMVLREVEAAVKAYNDKVAAGKKRHNKDKSPLLM